MVFSTFFVIIIPLRTQLQRLPSNPNPNPNPNPQDSAPEAAIDADAFKAVLPLLVDREMPEDELDKLFLEVQHEGLGLGINFVTPESVLTCLSVAPLGRSGCFRSD